MSVAQGSVEQARSPSLQAKDGAVEEVVCPESFIEIEADEASWQRLAAEGRKQRKYDDSFIYSCHVFLSVLLLIVLFPLNGWCVSCVGMEDQDIEREKRSLSRCSSCSHDNHIITTSVDAFPPSGTYLLNAVDLGLVRL